MAQFHRCAELAHKTVQNDRFDQVTYPGFYLAIKFGSLYLSCLIFTSPFPEFFKQLTCLSA